MRTRILRSMILSAAVLAIGTTANAVQVGKGNMVLDVHVTDMDNTQACTYLTFDNVTNDVFGVDVNLGTDMSGGILCTGVKVAGVQQDAHCTSYPDTTKWTSDGPSTGVCLNPPTCNESSFVAGAGVVVSGAVATSVGPDIAWTADGEYAFGSPVPNPGSSSIPGCTIPAGFYHATGTIALNAFQTQSTAVGSDQTVTFAGTTFFNPLTNAESTVDVGVTFNGVTVAGTTTVTATSNTAAEIPANFAFAINGYQPAFLEVSTTAEIAAPIEICSSYADENDDGFLDGTSPPVAESALSFLHGENGDFVDRTTSRDAVGNVICATVDTLSPFAVLVRTTGICAAENDPCDDGDACTVTDACNASLECVGSGAPDCSDGNACTQDLCESPGGCAHPPAIQGGCNATAGKAKLSIRDSSDDGKDALQFQWQKGTSSLASFGTPATDTTYTVCVSDADHVLLSAIAPEATMCGDDACWTSSTKGVKYADKRKPAENDGISQILGAGSDEAGKAKLQLKASGENLPAIDVGFVTYPVMVQVLTDNAGCWQQQFLSTDEKKFDGVQLKLGHTAP